MSVPSGEGNGRPIASMPASFIRSAFPLATFGDQSPVHQNVLFTGVTKFLIAIPPSDAIEGVNHPSFIPFSISSNAAIPSAVSIVYFDTSASVKCAPVSAGTNALVP